MSTYSPVTKKRYTEPVCQPITTESCLSDEEISTDGDDTDGSLCEFVVPDQGDNSDESYQRSESENSSSEYTCSDTNPSSPEGTAGPIRNKRLKVTVRSRRCRRLRRLSIKNDAVDNIDLLLKEADNFVTKGVYE